MAGALKLKRVIANSRNVLAIEALAAAQALDILSPLKPSKRAQQAMSAIRKVAKMMDHDRSLAPDMARVADVISRGEIAEVLR
jgi:histidine ammonia-lyase